MNNASTYNYNGSETRRFQQEKHVQNSTLRYNELKNW